MKTADCQGERRSQIRKSTSTTEYPSPEMIHAGEVTPGRRGKAVERARAVENAVQVKQGRRAGTGTVRGREQRKGEETYIVPTKRETAELLQQSSGVPRFGKRRLHLQTV